MMSELSGNPAHKFTWLIAERQFSVTHDEAEGDSLMAVSSSMDTWLKCMADMLKISHPNDHEPIEFQIKSGTRDNELYEAYLLGCEDTCIPEPKTFECFMEGWNRSKLK